MTMRRALRMAAIAVGLLLVSAASARADSAAQPSCDDVLAAWEEAGGSKSTDQLAKQLSTTPARVRECLDKTKSGKDPVPLKSPAAAE